MSARRAWPSERAVLVVVALLVRLVVVAAAEPEPVWDGRYFDAFARRLARGEGYTVSVEGDSGALRPTAHYPVGYPALLALAYRLFGDRVGVAFLVQCALGAALVAVVHAIAERTSGPRGARVAGLVAALHPGLVLQAPLVMAEPLAALLYACLVACMLHTPAHLGIAALGGLVAGFATLVRPQTLLLAPALVACALMTAAPASSEPRVNEGPASARSDLRRSFAAALVFAGALAAVVAPWSLRNARVLDGPALVSTNGGWNLAIGALPGATGRYRALPSGHGCEAIGGEVAVDRCLGAKARDAIAADPRAFLALVPAKLSYAIDYEAFPVEALHEAHPERVPEGLRRAAWRVLMVLHQALLLGAAVAVFRLRRARVWIGAAAFSLLPMIALGRPTSGGVAVALGVVLCAERAILDRLVGASLLVFLGTHAVFFGEDRYHVVLEALLTLPLAARFPGAAAEPGSQRRAGEPGADAAAIAAPK
jgi:hypothetical protein